MWWGERLVIVHNILQLKECKEMEHTIGRGEKQG